MNIKSTNKLSGIPKIFYFARDDSHQNIEEFFNEWQIKNYEKVLIPNSNNKTWKKSILDKNLSLSDDELVVNFTYIKTIIDWYDTNDSEYCILMTNNTNINLANHWTFDWKMLMKALPYNWDCIQLGIIPQNDISMHLKPKSNDIVKTFCFMITRQFAKKLKNLHYKNKKYTLSVNCFDLNIQEYFYGDINYFLFELGITYTFPVFNLFGGYSNKDEEKISNHIGEWWKLESKKFTVFDKFHFYKKNDSKMKIFFDQYDYKNDISKKLLNVKLISDGQMILWI